MNATSFQTNIDKKQLPQIESSRVTSSGLKIDFHGGKDAYYELKVGESSAISGEMHDIAKLLVEHMDIIEDSRMQIKKGNTITWDEIKKTHAKRGK